MSSMKAEERKENAALTVDQIAIDLALQYKKD